MLLKYHSFEFVSVNYILEGKIISKPKLSKAELMIDRYLMKRQYERRTSLRKFGDGILAPVGIKSQDTTFCLGFRPTCRNIKAVIAQKWERRHAKATRRTCDTTLKIHHLSVTFPTPHYSYHLNPLFVHLRHRNKHWWAKRLSQPVQMKNLWVLSRGLQVYRILN